MKSEEEIIWIHRFLAIMYLVMSAAYAHLGSYGLAVIMFGAFISSASYFIKWNGR